MAIIPGYASGFKRRSPEAAKAIADTMSTTLLLAWSGETFMLSAMPIWVRGIAVGLSVSQGGPI